MNKHVWIMLLLIVSMILSSCAANRRMAEIRKVESPGNSFSQAAAENFRYYVYGPVNRPIAFLALDKNYPIESEFWHLTSRNSLPVNNDGEFLLSGSKRHGKGFKTREIINAESSTVGIIYTRYHWVTAWFQENDQQLTIPPPQLANNQPGKARVSRDSP